MAIPSGALATRIHTLATALLADFATRQETYRTNRGRYWQGIRTPVVVPLTPATVAPNLTLRPTDQAESWADAGVVLPAQVEVSIQVDVYQAPGGHGFVVCVFIRMSATETWMRCYNVGPETWRTHDWQQIRSVP